MISIIVAMAKNRVIGNKNQIPWHISEDLTHFNKITSGHPVIMGVKTHESISGFEPGKGWDPSKPLVHKLLPRRTNIIVNDQGNYDVPGGIVVTNLDDAIKVAKESEGGDEMFIIGGAMMYESTIGMADKLYITMIDAEVEGDRYFPEIPPEFKLVEDKKRICRLNEVEIRYSFQVYQK